MESVSQTVYIHGHINWQDHSYLLNLSSPSAVCKVTNNENTIAIAYITLGILEVSNTEVAWNACMHGVAGPTKEFHNRSYSLELVPWPSLDK